MVVSGEPYSIMGTSNKAGYLYLFHIHPDGDVKLIFPVGKQDNRIPAGDKFTIGAEGNKELRWEITQVDENRAGALGP